MRSGNSAGTLARCFCTWRTWREASHSRVRISVSRKAANSKVNIRGGPCAKIYVLRKDYMAANDQRLVWLDMEMTGLDPEKERIIEVAVVVTEADLTFVAEGPVLVIHQSDALLDAMDKWNQSTHGKSGLIDKVKASTLTEAQAEDQLLAFLSQHVPAGKSPMCGNTIGQDRRFMVKYMPKLEAFFHYPNLDVSTLK